LLSSSGPRTARDRFGDTSIVRIVGVGRLVRDKSDRPQPSQITFRCETATWLEREADYRPTDGEADSY